jgi:NADH-ubiquinone oxidoreductase chain 2
LVSSLFSLIIGSVLGLTQSRIKRLFAYSTISHVGFILLALSVNSIESIQAYFFYIIAYTISNLNAFIILLSIGYYLYLYVHNTNNTNSDNSFALDDKLDKYSPIQHISQLKGLFFINPYLALSLTITLFSFVGVPPLIGFFAKQMILSAALDNGFIFITLIAILTSVIGAVYYLNVIKQIFFYKSDYIYNSDYKYMIKPKNENNIAHYVENNIVLSGSLSITISILTLILLLFIYIPNE